MTLFAFAIVLFLAWSNGSNDNFKGVATIYGSGTASYRVSLAWATVTTLAGSLLTLWLAAGLVKTFSAKGLVPDAVAASPAFLSAAALGAALTVSTASRLGLPVSTTHSLTGALLGAGLASGSGVNPAVLGKSFFLPLIGCPLLAIAITAVLYPLARFARRRMGITRDSYIRIEEELVLVSANSSGAAMADERVRLAIASGVQPIDRYAGTLGGISAQRALDVLHFLSAGAVSFARGLNDTPKIVAILIGAKAVGVQPGLFSIGVAMALGGLLGARRVAETMAKKIVTLNSGQGLVANLTTAGLVIAASRAGLPVSTTHVATGGLFGIGMITGTARLRTITSILFAWATTLPLGALLGAAAMLLQKRLG